MKLSIIVPVYNAQRYIDKCVKSILTQNFKDFELLLINDGSKDNSSRIIHSYSDPRIRVIDKENSGVSRTRNAGIEAAKGEYIQFIDSDDWLTPDSSQLMVSMADESKADMVISDFYRVVSERVSKKGDIYESGLISLELYAEYMMENPADYYYGVLWNKLFRRDILIENNIRMNPEVSWCEDFLFIMEYLMNCRNIYVLKAPVYYYVKRQGSLINQHMTIQDTVRMKQSVFEYYQNFYKKVLSKEEYNRSKLYIYKFLSDAATDGFVPPSFTPLAYRLGKERLRLLDKPNDSDSVYSKLFYYKRMFEKELETAAFKNRISLTEAQILYCIDKANRPVSYSFFKELAGISQAELFVYMQKLIFSGYISSAEVRVTASEEKKFRFTITSKANDIMKDIHLAEQRYLENRI